MKYGIGNLVEFVDEETCDQKITPGVISKVNKNDTYTIEYLDYSCTADGVKESNIYQPIDPAELDYWYKKLDLIPRYHPGKIVIINNDFFLDVLGLDGVGDTYGIVLEVINNGPGDIEYKVGVLEPFIKILTVKQDFICMITSNGYLGERAIRGNMAKSYQELLSILNAVGKYLEE